MKNSPDPLDESKDSKIDAGLRAEWMADHDSLTRKRGREQRLEASIQAALVFLDPPTDVNLAKTILRKAIE